MSFRTLCLIAALWFSAAMPVHAQAAAATTATPDRELTVGVKEAPPFVAILFLTGLTVAADCWSG
jgi:hypothetical protein